jgi:hypothetical protein
MDIVMKAGGQEFAARFEESAAPRTCALFRSLLPFRNKMIHVRWSGEACWIPLGDNHFDLPWENATSHPFPGQVILYPGGVSETEFLIAYGAVSFASKVGQLAGNHFLTLLDPGDRLAKLCVDVLWKGAHDVSFELL